MQHNQYNSPMQLYSTENAEEQYRLHANQYAGMAESAPPGTLGSGRRQFDPQQSETLRLIQEESNLQNGQYPQQDFFDKVAVAEEPRVPADQQPQWVSEARDRSTRARSHTPNSRQFLYRNDPYDGYLPSGPPPVFTTDTVGLPTVRYNSLPRQRRSPSRHTPVPGASERGYLFGGMDFIDHSRDTELFNVDDDYQDWMQRRSRKDQERRSERPGHKFGLDFNSSPRRGEGIAYDENYQGYTAQYPRKVWHFAADPLAPCNTYVTDVVECVDPVRLVGDTLSNHRIPMERPIPDEEKNNLGTAFSPTPGFTYEHRTVRPQTPDPEPVCYSLSVKKHLARADNYTPPRSQSVGANQYRADRYRGGVTQAPLDATTFANRQALLGQGNLEGEGGAVSQQPPHQSQAQWDSQASQQSQAQWNSQTGQTQQRYATGQQQHIGQPHAAQQHSGQSRDDQRQFNQQRVDQRQVEQRNVDQRQFEQRTVGQQQGARQPAAQQHVDRQQYTAQSNQQQGGQWQANNQQQQGAQWQSNQQRQTSNQQQQFDGGNQRAPAGQTQMADWSTLVKNRRNLWEQQSRQMDDWAGRHQGYKVIRSERPVFLQRQPDQTQTVVRTAPSQQQQPPQSNDYGDYAQNQSGNWGSSSEQQFRQYSSSQQQPQRTTTNYYSPQQALMEQPEANGYVIRTQKFEYSQQGDDTPSNRPPLQLYEQSAYTRRTEQPTGGAQRPQQPQQQQQAGTQQSQRIPQQEVRPQVQQQATQQRAPQQQQFQRQSAPQQQQFQQSYQQQYIQEEDRPNAQFQQSSAPPPPPPHQPRPAQQSQQSNWRETTYQQQQTEGNSSFPRPAWQQKAQPPAVPPKPQNNARFQHQPPQGDTQQAVVTNKTRDYDRYYHKETIEENGEDPRVIQYSTQKPADFDRYAEMNEELPHGQLSNSYTTSNRDYRELDGQDVAYRRELITSADPGRESELLKEEEQRTFEEQTEPGVIARHTTTKYYKKKTVTDQSQSAFI